ncbi:MAG: MFS transporter [Firmicutes bacterium]|nr:MFS transporter [Alicyclobacillaceae bacterium]MCL6496238.1 MFS transporter [Bacillota bacterium]
MEQTAQSVLQVLDETPVTPYHWRTILTTGLGFFTDAYDLFIIGTATSWLAPRWHLGAWQVGLLNSTALLASVAGCLGLGWWMDRLGRRALYGLEAALLTVGAVVSALAPNFLGLLSGRALVGLGVGGDYPASAVIVSEFANRSDRGRLVTLVFAMQGLGLLAGPGVALALAALGLEGRWGWRLCLGLGAVPALAAFFLRRGMAETPRFALHVRGDVEGARAAVSRVVGGRVPSMAPARSAVPPSEPWRLFRPPLSRRLAAATAAWFLVDVAFYGLGIFSQPVLAQLGQALPGWSPPALALAVFALSALPGYLVAAWQMDRMGRRAIQTLGFSVMAAAYALLAVMAGRPLSNGLLLVILYALSYFFVEFGPNATTFLYPSELFPTPVRGQGHGIAAAGGKLGAWLAAFCFPWALSALGARVVFFGLAGSALAGVAVTCLLLPEPKRQSLEELSHGSGATLHETYSRILEALSQERVADAMAAEAAILTGADWALVHEVEDGRRRYALRGWYPPEAARLLAEDGGPAAGLVGQVDRSRQPVWIRGGAGERFGPARSAVALPLVDRTQMVGVLSLWHRDADGMGAAQVQALGRFLRVAALALAYQRQYRSLAEQALTDPLTQLLNRRGLELEIERRRGLAARFAFVLWDLDRFKAHNDTWGHQSGDAVLAAIGEHLRAVLGPNDAAARLGGDEFILLLDGTATPEAARAQLAVLAPDALLARFGLGLSMGISLYPLDGDTYQTLYRVADRRLYAAKQRGGGRAVAGDDEGAPPRDPRAFTNPSPHVNTPFAGD